MGNALGTRKRATSSNASPVVHRRSSSLFIEMEERHGKSQWTETGRWNHALEEELIMNAGHEEWSRPHLPTLSVPALVHLRQCLGAQNILLDVPGSTLAVVVDRVLAALVAQNALPAESFTLAKHALSGSQLTNRPTVDEPRVKMLEPDRGEEALDLLLAHVPFVERQVLAFVRLKSAIDAGDPCLPRPPASYLSLSTHSHPDGARSQP